MAVNQTDGPTSRRISIGLDGQVQGKIDWGSINASPPPARPPAAAPAGPDPQQPPTPEQAQMGFVSILSKQDGLVFGGGPKPGARSDWRPMMASADGKPFTQTQIDLIKTTFGEVSVSQDGKTVQLPPESMWSGKSSQEKFEKISQQLGVLGHMERHATAMQQQAAAHLPTSEQLTAALIAQRETVTQTPPPQINVSQAALVEALAAQTAIVTQPAQTPQIDLAQLQAHAADRQQQVNGPAQPHPPGTTGLPGFHGNTVYVTEDGRLADMARGIQPAAPAPAPQARQDLSHLFPKDAPIHVAPPSHLPPPPAIHVAAAPPAHQAGHSAPAAHHTNPDKELEAAAMKALKGASVAVIKQFQQACVRAGEEMGHTGKGGVGVDGDPGPKTVAALVKMCKDSGIHPSEVKLDGPSNKQTETMMAHLGGKIIQNELEIAQTKERAQAHMAAKAPASQHAVLGDMCAPATPNCKAGGASQGRS